MLPKTSLGLLFAMFMMFGGMFFSMFTGGSGSGLPDSGGHDQATMDLYVKISIMPEVCTLLESERLSMVETLALVEERLSEQDLRIAKSLARTKAAAFSISGERDAACNDGFVAMGQV